MYVYVCICMYMYVYVCICICMYMYVYVCKCMYVYVCICMYVRSARLHSLQVRSLRRRFELEHSSTWEDSSSYAEFGHQGKGENTPPRDQPAMLPEDSKTTKIKTDRSALRSGCMLPLQWPCHAYVCICMHIRRCTADYTVASEASPLNAAH